MMTRQPTEGKSKNGGMCLLLLYLLHSGLSISVFLDLGNNLEFHFTLVTLLFCFLLI